MKTRLLILTSIIALVALLSSCGDKSDDSVKDQLKSYVAALRPYYPYTLDEEFVFVNEETGNTWSAKACDPESFGYYPYSFIEDLEKEHGVSYAGKVAYLLPDSLQGSLPSSDLSTTIFIKNLQAHVHWGAGLEVGANMYYEGEYEYTVPIDQFISTIPDTIIIPLKWYYQRDTHESASLHSGAYVRIVKGQGFTDFSVDGETVWRRVVKNE